MQQPLTVWAVSGADAKRLREERLARAGAAQAEALAIGLPWPKPEKGAGRPSARQHWHDVLYASIIAGDDLPDDVGLEPPAWWKRGDGLSPLEAPPAEASSVEASAVIQACRRVLAERARSCCKARPTTEPTTESAMDTAQVRYRGRTRHQRRRNFATYDSSQRDRPQRGQSLCCKGLHSASSSSVEKPVQFFHTGQLSTTSI